MDFRKTKLNIYNIRNNFFFKFFFTVFLISCSTKHNQSDLFLDGDYYTIDLDGEKESSIPLSSLFKNIRTILLETGDDCLIGRINDLQVFDGCIYILDTRMAKSLFVFDMEGKYIRKIGSFGSGPGEYVSINDFTLDTENRIIFLSDHSNRIHKYKFDGTYLHTITIDAPNSHVDYIQFYNRRLYVYGVVLKKSEDDYMLLEVDPSDGKILSRSLPIKFNKGWDKSLNHSLTRFFMSRANDPPRFNLMFMDYVVSIGEDIIPYIELKSKNLTTEKDIDDFRDKDGRQITPLNMLNSKKLFHVHCFIENDDFISFRCGFTHYTAFVVLYYKKTGEMKLAEILSNDLIFRQDKQGKLGRFRFADSKGAYEILDTQDDDAVFDVKSAIRRNEVAPGLDKLDQLLNLTADSNPVIFFYEFK